MIGFGTFGFWRRRKPDMLEDPKGLIIENFTTSTEDFYQSVEGALSDMKLPDLAISREFIREGGPFSKEREYLRMRRERLIFDVCAAQFGTSFYFSIRFAEIPVVLYLWQLLVVLLFLGALGMMYSAIMGPFWGPSMVVLNVLAAVVLLPNLATLRLHRLDDFFMQIPIFGIVYEAWFRPETYHRIDSRAAYVETVKTIVQRRINEVTGDAGLKLTEIESLQPKELRDFASAMKRWTK